MPEDYEGASRAIPDRDDHACMNVIELTSFYPLPLSSSGVLSRQSLSSPVIPFTLTFYKYSIGYAKSSSSRPLHFPVCLGRTSFPPTLTLNISTLRLPIPSLLETAPVNRYHSQDYVEVCVEMYFEVELRRPWGPDRSTSAHPPSQEDRRHMIFQTCVQTHR